MASTAPSQIYDDIAFDYAAIRSNPFKVRCEETTFWAALGDISDQNVLDLACGSGHYSRAMRQRGAASVTGVDISSEMIAMAKAEEAERPLGGLEYVVCSAAEYKSSELVDCVTAQYLFPYAETKAELEAMCYTAFEALKSGGRFVSITTTWFDGANKLSEALGYAIDGSADTDGSKIQLTIFGAGRSSRVTFPNHLWSKSSIESALTDAGFASIGYQDLTVDGQFADWAAQEEVAADLERCFVLYLVATKA
eukprot:CAMPEP_0117537994 /NCGR_PEP_ID=MMETSP0784-20121206/42253_1 /TAXON_ID=39447 /ORGANISM="" /LENGTH=251 /DNA_ID=CAMNT_0005334601 /DNA_START=31 /DNA_END=786 /DNA_ORIENTATION=-